MIDSPKFIKMQKMFHGKSVTIAEIQPVAKIKTISIDVNVVDVNVTTRSKAIEKHVFKDRKPRKAKNVIDWEKKEWLKKSMLEAIKHIKKT
jgi:succinyl-CoA synthetase beta subunit